MRYPAVLAGFTVTQMAFSWDEALAAAVRYRAADCLKGKKKSVKASRYICEMKNNCILGVVAFSFYREGFIYSLLKGSNKVFIPQFNPKYEFLISAVLIKVVRYKMSRFNPARARIFTLFFDSTLIFVPPPELAIDRRKGSPAFVGVGYLLGDKNSRFLKSMLKIFKLVLFKALRGTIEVDANFPDMKQ